MIFKEKKIFNQKLANKNISMVWKLLRLKKEVILYSELIECFP